MSLLLQEPKGLRRYIIKSHVKVTKPKKEAIMNQLLKKQNFASADKTSAAYKRGEKIGKEAVKKALRDIENEKRERIKKLLSSD